MPKTPSRPPSRGRLFPQLTTLWDFPSQNYLKEKQGDPSYRGATPSYILWNVFSRFLEREGLGVDPFCGSGTSLDVARDLNRKVRGFDLHPMRKDIEPSDARHLPLGPESADLIFMDPPYSDHIHYSDHADCIGKLSAYGKEYFVAMGECFSEAHRVLKRGGMICLYVCDFFQLKKGFVPTGFRLFQMLTELFQPRDIVACARHNRDLEKGNYLKEALKNQIFLRGFNYLFLLEKPR